MQSSRAIVTVKCQPLCQMRGHKYSSRSPTCGNVSIPFPSLYHTACGLPDQPAAVPPSAFTFHRRYNTYSSRHQTSLKDFPPKTCIPKITPLVQSAALPWMVRAKLVHPVEPYVPTNLLFNVLCRVYFSKSVW